MAEPIALSVPIGDGVEVTLEWDAAATAESSEAGADGPWRITTPIRWDAITAVRLLCAEFKDHSALAVLAVRPAEAAGHDGEHVAAALRGRKGDESELERVLLSTEYGPDSEPARIGIELHLSDEEVPLRGAGDASASRVIENEAMRRSVTQLTMRLDGTEGSGTFEILKAP